MSHSRIRIHTTLNGTRLTVNGHDITRDVTDDPITINLAGPIPTVTLTLAADDIDAILPPGTQVTTPEE